MNKLSKTIDYKIILIVLVTVVWGSTFVVIKEIVNEVNEYFMVFVRTSIATVVMFAYSLYKNRIQLFTRQNIIYGLMLGFLLGGIYSSQVVGLKFTSAGHSAFITGIAVILVPVFLFLFWKQRFRWFEFVAISIVISGLFLLTYNIGEPVNKGDLITLVTAVVAAFHFILAGKYVVKTHALSLISWQFAGAALISLAGFVLFDNQWEPVSDKSLYVLLYLGLFGTLFCYFVYVWAQQYVSPMLIVLIFSLEPVFAAIFGYYFLTELLNLKEFFGALLIITGVIVYQIRRTVAKKRVEHPDSNQLPKSISN